MSLIMQKALSLLTGHAAADPTIAKMPKNRPFKKLTKRQLIQLESEIGRTIFGPIPAGHRREFFNLDPHTWIWHEEYKTADGQTRAITTRYEVKDKAILKVQDGAPYTYLEGEELRNFGLSVQTYYERVARELYHRTI